MADAIVSAVAKQLVDITVKQIRNEVNLVTGLDKELTDLSAELNLTRAVLEDAENRRYKDKSVRMWLNRLEATCNEMEDVLDEWDYYLLQQEVEVEVEHPPRNQKVCSFLPSSSCFFFKKLSYHRNIAIKVKQVTEKLERVLKEKERYDLVVSEPSDHVDGVALDQSTSFVEIGDICGRDVDREILLTKLLENDGTSKEHLHIQTISVVGLGGIGKTTLAQLLFNDSQIEECFPLRIWICVSNPFDQYEIVKGIIQKITGTCPEANQLNLLLEHMKGALMEKKFLLVLDDVWTEERNKWEPLKDCLMFGRKGSKILVTTRNRGVAKMMDTMECDIHSVEELSNNDCWLILSRIALSDKSEAEQENFGKIGKEIANKCKGLPLAAKVLGNILRLKTTLLEWEDIAKSQMWELEKAEVELFPHLLLSYNELSPMLKRCFSYCGIFPEDFEIDVEFLINSWCALGYLGSNTDSKHRGREYLNNLVMRSLLHRSEWDHIEEHTINTCKMHDIVRSFARFIRHDASDGVVKAICQDCSSTTISKEEEYRSLLCFDDGSPGVICECLRSLRVYSSVSDDFPSYCFPRGIEKLIHLRELNVSNNGMLGMEDLKAICKLYHLKILILVDCNLAKRLPKEIGNLTRLEHLDLSSNHYLKIPEAIGALHELRYFNISGCLDRSRLPWGIQNLTKLEILHNRCMRSGPQSPDESVSNLIRLSTLDEFNEKLSDLKKLNQLRGELNLFILDFNDVREAREAELNKKEHLQRLCMVFRRTTEEADANKNKDWNGVLDALQPHHNLDFLKICGYMGSKLPNWIASPHNQVTTIVLIRLPKVVSLPAFGNLPCLEVLEIMGLPKMEVLGEEFMGITRGSGHAKSCSPSTVVVASVVVFPKLMKLQFDGCKKWKEWEDISTIEEEEASTTTLSLFPSLQELSISRCPELRGLPDRLLCSASSLNELTIDGSPLLKQRYDKNEEDSGWNSISHIPHVYIYGSDSDSYYDSGSDWI